MATIIAVFRYLFADAPKIMYFAQTVCSCVFCDSQKKIISIKTLVFVTETPFTSCVTRIEFVCVTIQGI